jgi:signal peptidase II
MVALAAGLVFIPLADQALKLVLRRWLGPGSVPLGRVGGLRILRTRIWLARRGGRQNVAGMWTLWLLAAGAVAFLSALFPSCGWFAGLLLGGSLSHALESSARGSVSDYVCLRFWPAFNLADVAITVGAIGVLLTMFMAMKDLWS